MTNIRKLQDVQVDDSNIIENYRNTFNNESIDSAHNLINTNRLRSYVLQAEWMNTVKTKIESLEKNHQSEEKPDTYVDEILNEKTQEFQNNIDRTLYKGTYSAEEQYYKNNFVLFEDDIYFCIQNSLNNFPINENYWIYIGLRGEKGQYSLGVVYRGEWNYSTEYRKYDLVFFNNNLYIARRNNIYSQPEPREMYYLDNNLNLSNNFYLTNQNPYPEREMNFLNSSLFLSDNTYLRNSWTDEDWFLLTATDEEIQIYDSPTDYTTLPNHAIFFQKL